MDPKQVRKLLESVRGGEVSIDQALGELADLPFRDLGFAQVDHHRHLRTGFPEVVLGSGKTAEQIAAILNELKKGGANLLATRVEPDKAALVVREVAGAKYDAGARAIVVEQQPIEDT